METSHPLPCTELVHAIYKSRCTVRCMLQQRGYTCRQEEETLDTYILLHFSAATYFNTVLIFDHPTRPSIFVLWPDEEKLRLNTVRAQLEWCDTYQIQHLMLVYKESITSMTTQFLSNVTDVRIESFSVGQLQYRVNDHVSVPTHRLLSEQEKLALQRLHGKKTEYCRMMSSDAMAKWLGAGPGSMVEVLRRSPEGTVHITYRKVGR